MLCGQFRVDARAYFDSPCVVQRAHGLQKVFGNFELSLLTIHALSPAPIPFALHLPQTLVFCVWRGLPNVNRCPGQVAF